MSVSDNSEDRVHELLDILVQEVSDVDRAANKRRYLTIKNEYGAEVVEKDDGSLTVERSEHTDADEDNTQASGAMKQNLTMPRQVKRALMRTAGEALERLMNVVNRVRDAEETTDSPKYPMPDVLAQEMRSVAGLLTAALERYPAPMLAKRGAKLSSRRRAQLKAVIGLLQKILDEVSPAKSAPAGATPGMRSLDPNRANAGAGTQPDLSVTRDARRELSDMPGMRDVLKRVSDLTDMVKQQAEDLRQIRKMSGTPASRPFEAISQRPQSRPNASEHVAWPIDMNNELSRESVDKRVSFFDIDE